MTLSDTADRIDALATNLSTCATDLATLFGMVEVNTQALQEFNSNQTTAAPENIGALVTRFGECFHDGVFTFAYDMRGHGDPS